MITTNKPLGSSSNNAADQAAQGADSAIKSTQRYANEALDTMSDKVQELRDQAAPVLNRVAEKAETLARRGMGAVKDSSQQLRERATQVSDNTVGYQGRARQGDPHRSRHRCGADGAHRNDDPFARLILRLCPSVRRRSRRRTAVLHSPRELR